jgi:hypothetical protein
MSFSDGKCTEMYSLLVGQLLPLLLHGVSSDWLVC